MCGIVAYIGHRDACPIILKGLKRLEYRGYDSAGVALLDGNKEMKVYKKTGKVSDLENEIGNRDTSAFTGMGHTRWATHGEPNDRNAHPHLSGDGEFAIIHNGIIENYSSLKEMLIKRGHTFLSDTDTEVLIHLIEEVFKNNEVKFEEAVRMALTQVVGAYAIVILSKKDPNYLIGAKKGSPMVIGVGENEHFIASDATPIVEYTRNVVYIQDGEIAIIEGNNLTIKTIDNSIKTPYIQEIEFNLENIEKGGYEHFMLKEIFEQPRSIMDSFRGRIHLPEGRITMAGIDMFEDKIKNLDRIIIIGCGTSWHAGLVGEYLFEDLARVPCEVEYASEFRYRNPVIRESDFVIAISQSGETADTLAALELAKKKGATIFGICNVVGASIPRMTDAGAYTHAGPEIGVASTKAFTAQVTALTLMALSIAQKKGTITSSRLHEILSEIETIPGKIEQVLKTDTQIKVIAEELKDSRNALYLGRGYGFPIALEGALKLKEISYIHAEGYPAAEMKHGPIALIDEEMPVIVIATQHSNYEKVISNIQEVKARKGRVIAIATEGDSHVETMCDHVVYIPNCDEALLPLIATIPLQLLSYHIAVLRGCNVDQPRNLAKSVTVE
ncbi:MAG: glutamine--fructose-6-phosphate transaminase (isomerizing) [Bacteroidia bacterium]|nr:glutamine--fructose-6-phosphate transaminase (isomerizing) [Bacteroidia bacterium]MCF8428229.1 glutamine--fructose-6-phosphate transaminase (isomerizing) [Bacteroidia bacterium]MCF8446957.1 glutamine--fructose-6-phosphate transaminase (isomerizing) [Bacteroidia bacterium]